MFQKLVFFQTAPGRVNLPILGDLGCQKGQKSTQKWVKNRSRTASGQWSDFSSRFSWIFGVFSLCFWVRFSPPRFRMGAVLAKCAKSVWYAIYIGFWQFSRFACCCKIKKKRKFRVKFRCEKQEQLCSKFPWKIDARNTENLMKIG